MPDNTALVFEKVALRAASGHRHSQGNQRFILKPYSFDPESSPGSIRTTYASFAPSLPLLGKIRPEKKTPEMPQHSWVEAKIITIHQAHSYRARSGPNREALDRGAVQHPDSRMGDLPTFLVAATPVVMRF